MKTKARISLSPLVANAVEEFAEARGVDRSRAVDELLFQDLKDLGFITFAPKEKDETKPTPKKQAA